MGKKFKMPDANFLLANRIRKNKAHEPVWIFLEREMRANADNKPYNKKVGEWLVFLRDLKRHYQKQRREELKRLERECGPVWYIELSNFQREILDGLKHQIHKDLIAGQTYRVEKSLYNLGLTKKIPTQKVMNAMQASTEDPGVFIWRLYTDIYKVPPSTLLPSYDYNSRLLMSCLVFIDYKECLELLDKVMEKEPPPPTKPPKRPPKYFQPQVKFGEYLSKMYAPYYSNQPKKKSKVIQPLKLKLRVRSAESLETILHDDKFLERRRERNRKEQCKERICHYKFWEPPASLRYTDPKMQAYAMALLMFKKRARPSFKKHKPPYENVQYYIGGVSYLGGKAHYVLNAVCVMPTGFVPINGGLVKFKDEYVTNILGYWTFPPTDVDKCDSKCDCLAKWESSVMKYVEDSKCKCHHLYDFRQEGKPAEIYFHKPTKHGPYWLDHAKVYQLDPIEDFVKQCVRDALHSEVVSVKPISGEAFRLRDLVAALLAELGDTPLIIPHLPNANLLNNVQNFVRKKLKPPLTKKQHQRILCQSKRRWIELEHIDFRQLASYFGFTKKEMENFNWNHRMLVQKLFDTVLAKYVKQNLTKQIHRTRMFWATMQNDRYGGKSFKDCFFSYFPLRHRDLLLLDPYIYEYIDRYHARTCPLSF